MIKINIGIVTTWFERGAAYVSKQYYDKLSQKYKVYVYARGGEEYAINQPNWNQEYVTWGKKINVPVSTAIDLNDFGLWLKKNNIDIVFFNEQRWWEPVIFCHELGIKTGAYIDYYKEDTIPFFAIYDFLICNTKRHYETFKWHNNAYYIPWGTNIKLFNPETFSLIEKSKLTFFHSCGYNPKRKGTDILLKAFSTIKDKNTKLIIHSQVNLKAYFPELSNKIDSLINSGKLVYIEKTVSAPGLYKLGDVYVYPSRLDGLGLTIMEALSCGLPVITSNNSPMNEFIDGENGKLIDIHKYYCRSDGYYWPLCEPDYKNLSEILNSYIENYENISIYKKCARKYAENNLDWNKNSEGLIEIFDDINKISNEQKNNIIKEIRKYESYNDMIVKLYKNHSFLINITLKIYRRIKN